MNIWLDADICTGHGRCYDCAPDLFDCDDSGRGVLRSAEVLPDLEAQARRAVGSCPEGAIRIET